MTQEDIDATKAPLLDHLMELRTRLIYACIAILIAFVFCFYFAESIYEILLRPYQQAIGEDETSKPLIRALRDDTRPDGQRVFNFAVAMSIMVFFALCMQCASTLAIIRRETNSWWWPSFTFFYMTGLAYIGSFFTYQILA